MKNERGALFGVIASAAVGLVYLTYSEDMHYVRESVLGGLLDVFGASAGKVHDNLGTVPKETLQQSALAGDADAQFRLAIMELEEGGDSTEPHPEGLRWLQIAANSGNAMAMNEMGVVAEEGLYAQPVDYAAALDWYRRAMESGDEYAAFNMGRMYRDGAGIDRDDINATAYFQKAHDLGYVPSIFELGLRYQEGLGVERSRRKARQYFKMAASRGFDMQGFYRTELGYGDDVAIQLGLPQHLERRAKSYEDWATLSFLYATALARNPEVSDEALRALFDVTMPDFSQPLMSLALSDKDWADPNLHTRMFFVAALLGHREAQVAYAARLEVGLGAEVDLAEAAYWRSRAARQGDEASID